MRNAISRKYVTIYTVHIRYVYYPSGSVVHARLPVCNSDVYIMGTLELAVCSYFIVFLFCTRWSGDRLAKG